MKPLRRDVYTLGASPEEGARLERQAKFLYGGIDCIIPHAEGVRSILDVGCGVGTICEAISNDPHFHRAERIVGVDREPSRIVRAQELAAAREGRALEFKIADARHLPFASNSFDLVTTRFMLMHLQQPEAAIREMVRVARRGGKVLAHEGYHRHVAFHPPKPYTTRIIQAWATAMAEQGQNASIGPELYNMFLAAGLSDVRLEVLPHLVVGVDAAYPLYMKNWADELPRAAKMFSGEIDEEHVRCALHELKERRDGDVNLEVTFVAVGRKIQ